MSLNPRKMPSQKRSRVTVDAIFEATIQVLLSRGFEKLTTIEIAQRAGVSVGTLYQYYPNKAALLAALVRRHVSQVVDASVRSCMAARGSGIARMCRETVTAFVNAKTARPDVSRALYLPATAVGGDAIVREQSMRAVGAVRDMLMTATDARFERPDLVAQVLVSSLIGPTQRAIEADEGPPSFEALKVHLTALCIGYLREICVMR
jgi:AcrR family transcriptional regulator